MHIRPQPLRRDASDLVGSGWSGVAMVVCRLRCESIGMSFPGCKSSMAGLFKMCLDFFSVEGREKNSDVMCTEEPAGVPTV